MVELVSRCIAGKSLAFAFRVPIADSLRPSAHLASPQIGRNEIGKVGQRAQEQKDMYENEHRTVYSKCDDIKLALKKESDLENLREHMERRTQKNVDPNHAFWSTKFNIHRAGATRGARS